MLPCAHVIFVLIQHEKQINGRTREAAVALKAPHTLTVRVVSGKI